MLFSYLIKPQSVEVSNLDSFAPANMGKCGGVKLHILSLTCAFWANEAIGARGGGKQGKPQILYFLPTYTP